MGFVRAFEHLGHEPRTPRNNWSAEKPDGVRIPIRGEELKIPETDHEFAFPDGVPGWASMTGHKVRRDRVRRAIGEADRRDGTCRVELMKDVADAG